MTVYGQTILKQQGNSTTTIGTNIQNPHWFSWMQPSGSTYGYCPNKTPYYNSWSARNTVAEGNVATVADNIVVKTIYDPCPVGYTVAPVNAFSGMTANGWVVDDKGSLLQGCWFPITERRNGDSGNLGNNGNIQGCYWQAVPRTTSAARWLWFNPNIPAAPADGIGRSFGISVRPVEEIKENN